MKLVGRKIPKKQERKYRKIVR